MQDTFRASDESILTGRIHDDEPDTSEEVVRTLLGAECPEWSGQPLEYLSSSGTDNTMWRVRSDDGADLVVRLPRRPDSENGVLREIRVLEQLEHSGIRSIVLTPTVRHAGRPHEVFPHHWSVLEWINGSDAWADRHNLAGLPQLQLAQELAKVVLVIGELEMAELRVRTAGSRGGPILPLLGRLDGWLSDPCWHAEKYLDVNAIKTLAAKALEVVDEPVDEGFVHGDLIPGNLLVQSGRLSAIIDWGGAGYGDRPQDLAPAWSVLDHTGRGAFREAVTPSAMS